MHILHYKFTSSVSNKYAFCYYNTSWKVGNSNYISLKMCISLQSFHFITSSLARLQEKVYCWLNLSFMFCSSTMKIIVSSIVIIMNSGKLREVANKTVTLYNIWTIWEVLWVRKNSTAIFIVCPMHYNNIKV